MTGLVGVGIGGGVLLLDEQAILAGRRVGQRQRQIIFWLIILSVVTMGLALGLAAAGLALESVLGIALLLGVVAGVYALVAYSRALSAPRGESDPVS